MVIEIKEYKKIGKCIVNIISCIDIKISLYSDWITCITTFIKIIKIIGDNTNQLIIIK